MMYVIGASPSGKAAGFDLAIRWFESSRPCHYTHQLGLGASPSGKAAGFDLAIRWFESSRPCQFKKDSSGFTILHAIFGLTKILKTSKVLPH